MNALPYLLVVAVREFWMANSSEIFVFFSSSFDSNSRDREKSCWLVWCWCAPSEFTRHSRVPLLSFWLLSFLSFTLLGSLLCAPDKSQKKKEEENLLTNILIYKVRLYISELKWRQKKSGDNKNKKNSCHLFDSRWRLKFSFYVFFFSFFMSPSPIFL